MKVYRVHSDVNKFQSFFLEDKKLKLEFDGEPKLATWRPPAVFVLHPKLKKGNFFGFEVASGAWIADAVAVEELRDLLEISGELLPLTHGGEQFHVVNALECINILDHENTEWSVDRMKAEGVDLSQYDLPEGYKGHPERYAFHADRLTETPLFKIPEMSYVLTVEVLDHENTEWSLDELKAEGVDLSEYNLPEGYKGTVERHAFHADRLTETPLFKIPEDSDILTVEGMKDPEDEFKPRVERAKLKGLIFEELWSDES